MWRDWWTSVSFNCSTGRTRPFFSLMCDSGSPPACQLAFPALPPTANICHVHTQVKAQGTSHKLHVCTHARTHKCSVRIHANTAIPLINTQTTPPTHPHTQKLCSSLPASSSSPCLYFNLQARSSPRIQRGTQELRLQRHTRTYMHAHTWTCNATGTHGRMVQNEEQGKVEVARISILN